MTATKVRRANLISYSCGGSVEKGTNALSLSRRIVTWDSKREMGGGRGPRMGPQRGWIKKKNPPKISSAKKRQKLGGGCFFLSV